MIDLAQANRVDPLKRMAEKENGTQEYSPMDPPGAYEPPALDTVPYENMHPGLRKLIDDHKEMKKQLDQFEAHLLAFKQQGWHHNAETQKAMSAFFSFMDSEFVKHSQKEEKVLFPVLQAKMMEHEEHSKGKFPKTAIDMMEDDHLKIMQHLTLMFNFLSLATRLPDATSRALTFDVATEQGISLIELLKLHMFREENIVFPKGHQHISHAEFGALEKKMDLFNSY